MSHLRSRCWKGRAGTPRQLMNGRVTQINLKGNLRQGEAPGRNSWPAIPPCGCWASRAEPEEPKSMTEGPARQWQAEPRCFGRSGTPCRGDCYLMSTTAVRCKRKSKGHATALSSRHAGGAKLPREGATARAPAGKERKRTEFCESSCLTRNFIVPEVWERGK
jgi:hypothetical protein